MNIKKRMSENEKTYFESIEKNKGKYEFSNILKKYIKIEETNPKLKKLIHNFSYNKNKNKRLNSVNSSLKSMEKKTKVKFNYENDEKFFNKNTKKNLYDNIHNRSKNIKISNRHKKHKIESNFIFNSKMENILGFKRSLYNNIIKKSHK